MISNPCFEKWSRAVKAATTSGIASDANGKFSVIDDVVKTFVYT